MTTTEHVSSQLGNAPSAGRQVPGARLPVAPRERKPALAALAVLLILGGALVTTTLVLRSDDAVAAVAIARPVHAGQQIPRSALTRVRVPRDGGPRYLSYTDANIRAIARAYARVELYPGSLLLQAQTINVALDPGQVVVGLSLRPEQFPAAELHGGEIVTAYLTDTTNGNNDANVGKPIATRARVLTISSDDDQRSFDSGSSTVVSLVVSAEDAGALTRASAKNAVALVLTSQPARGG